MATPATTEHDEFCRCSDPSWRNPAFCTCEEIALIRASEQRRTAVRRRPPGSDATRAEALADLREQVVSLVQGNGYVMALLEVLDLIDGGPDADG